MIWQQERTLLCCKGDNHPNGIIGSTFLPFNDTIKKLGITHMEKIERRMECFGLGKQLEGELDMIILKPRTSIRRITTFSLQSDIDLVRTMTHLSRELANPPSQ